MEAWLKRRLEIGFGVILLAIFVLLFVVSLDYPSKPRQLPMIVDAVGIAAILVHLFGIIRKPATPGKVIGAPINWRAVMLGFGTLFAYLILAYFFGMVWPMILLIYGTSVAFGGKSKKISLLVAVVTTLAIWALFSLVLGIPLYRGILFR